MIQRNFLSKIDRVEKLGGTTFIKRPFAPPSLFRDRGSRGFFVGSLLFRFIEEKLATDDPAKLETLKKVVGAAKLYTFENWRTYDKTLAETLEAQWAGGSL